VKFLERTYRALGLETTLVYTDLHANDAPVPSTAEVASASPKPQGFSLDPARIAQLQKEPRRSLPCLRTFLWKRASRSARRSLRRCRTKRPSRCRPDSWGWMRTTLPSYACW
jgi:hypothetical protein